MFGTGYGKPTGDNSGASRGDDGLKDSTARAVTLGILTPTIILIIVISNVLTGTVVWPGGRGTDLLISYNRFWPVAGTVLIKLGVAGILLAWYGLANTRRWESYCWPVAIVCTALTAIGLVIFVAGALVG